MYTNIIHNDDICNYFLKNQQFIFNSLGNCRECRMNGIAKLGGWLHLPLNPLRMQKLTENYVVSNAKIKAALGIEQMPVRAKDGLMDTIKSFGE